ncbi:hypothetical protein PMAYCL1PPCAC_30470, partial [Pristionchus mayeri]
NAPYKCKICKQFGFWCRDMYAAHYETCQPMSIGAKDSRCVPCAPRCEDAFLHKGRPLSHKWKLPILPEDIGNELRQCRLCGKEKLSHEGLLLHRKDEHPVKHFTDAPYQCQKCGDFGFYTHVLYKRHTKKCTGRAPSELESSIYVITTGEVEKRANVKRVEIPSYRALIDVERREHGTFAAFNRPTKCPLCDMWCSSMRTLAEHYRDGHKNKEIDPFVCGGCGQPFTDIEALHRHLNNQNVLGEAMCFDMAVVFDIRTTNTKRAPTVSTIASSASIRPVTLHRPMIQQRPFGVPPVSTQLGLNAAKYTIKSEAHSASARKQAGETRRKLMLPIRPINLMAKSPLTGERAAYRQQQFKAAINRQGTDQLQGRQIDPRSALSPIAPRIPQPSRPSYLIAKPPEVARPSNPVQSCQAVQQSRPIIQVPRRVVIPQQGAPSVRPMISRPLQFVSDDPISFRTKSFRVIPQCPQSQVVQARPRPTEPKIEPKEEPTS